MELEPAIEQPQWRGWVGGTLGVLSAMLLYASFRWAHHWGPRADALVAAWALASLGALTVSIWSLVTSGAARSLARLGVSLALVSLLALTIVALAVAAGGNSAAPCGGG